MASALSGCAMPAAFIAAKQRSTARRTARSGMASGKTCSMELWARTIPNRMRDAVIRDLSADAVCLTMPGTRIICIVPQHLPSSIATHDAGKLRATFDRGIADALAHESELRTLLST